MARHASQFRSQRGKRRKVTWSAGPSGLLAVSAEGALAFPQGAAASLPDLTLQRIRGEVNAALDTTGAVLEGFTRVAFGIANVSENAAGIGSTAIPHPITDIDWDGWIWHWIGSIYTVASAPTDSEGTANVRILIDNKAQRKVHAGDTLVGMVEVAGEVGTAQMQVNLNTRVLDMLP